MRANRFVKKHIGVLCLLFLCLLLCSGCGDVSDTKIVLTTGLKADEVFRIEKISCSKPEMMVYITNMQNQYENIYGDRIWDSEAGDTTLGDRVRENALAKMAQVKTMNLMADSMGIALSSQELKSVENAADIYYGSLNSTEIKAMGIDKDTIYTLYREYMTAQKVYGDVIKDINPEVSDDEARNITVEYILIQTYTTDGTGRRHDMTGDELNAAYSRAQEAWQRAVDGEDFDALVAEYSDSDELLVSFGKDDISSDYARSMLFNLASDEISDVLTFDDGYMIAKCVSTYNLEETDRNKIRIVERERETVFGEVYDSYVQDLTRKLNVELWDSIELLHDDEITTSSFFSVADDNLVMDNEIQEIQ